MSILLFVKIMLFIKVSMVVNDVEVSQKTEAILLLIPVLPVVYEGPTAFFTPDFDHHVEGILSYVI